MIQKPCVLHTFRRNAASLSLSAVYLSALACLPTAVLAAPVGVKADTERQNTHKAAIARQPGANFRLAGAVPAASLAGPVQLSYHYKQGDVSKYKVTAFFNGHFPPFASAGSPPIHLVVALDYIATVKKSDDKGTEIEYSVENADISLLEDEPKDDKVDPDKAAPFPVPLSQVQKMFNVTAMLKPDGSIADIKGGDTSSVKIDLGIDLRKLFLVTAPVIFSDKPVKTGDSWPFNDGLLGSKAGKTTYSGKLESIGAEGKKVTAILSEDGTAAVDNKLDKEGNSTESSDAAVGSLTGKVTLTGKVNFLSAGADPKTGVVGGRVHDGKLNMVVVLKRTLPDPDQPGQQKTDDIDVKARLIVAVANPSAQPTGAGNKPVKKTGTGADKGKKAKQ